MANNKKRRRRKSDASSPAAEGSREEPFCAGWIWWSAAADSPRKPAKDDYYNPKKIPVHIRAELDKMRDRYKRNELRNGLHVKSIGDGILELVCTRDNNPYRLLFTRWGKWAVALDVFFKNQQKTDKTRAIERRAAWLRTRGNTPPE